MGRYGEIWGDMGRYGVERRGRSGRRTRAWSGAAPLSPPRLYCPARSPHSPLNASSRRRIPAGRRETAPRSSGRGSSGATPMEAAPPPDPPPPPPHPPPPPRPPPPPPPRRLRSVEPRRWLGLGERGRVRDRRRVRIRVRVRVRVRVRIRARVRASAAVRVRQRFEDRACFEP